ncbi:MAG: serine/threonine-protein kinase M1 [Bogoriella megaspora]|nr:MAG: serine/threonine-protein kinase M1 [Bogoriella megaspora]
MAPSFDALAPQASVNSISGHGYENGPPPSTLAAQIVRNHETGAQVQKEEQRSTFGDLLQEILNSAASEETELEVNYKLVRVVTEAGLDCFLHDDPFTRRGSLVDQGKDSVSVIELTVRRQPQLLFSTRPKQNGTQQDTLFAWILPRILALLGNSKADGIYDRLKELLLSFVSSLSRSTKCWQHSVSILKVFEGCAKELASALHKHAVRDGSAALAIDLPPGDSILGSRSTSEQGIAQKMHPQCNISAPSHACQLALALIEVLFRATSPVESLLSSQSMCCKFLNAGINICARVWQTYPKWSLWMGSLAGAERLATAYLHLLQPEKLPVLGKCATTVLIEAVSDMLKHQSVSALGQHCQFELAKSLLAIWDMSADAADDNLLCEQLIPLLSSLHAQSSSTEGLLPELKIALSFCATSYSSNPIHGSPAASHQNQRPRFLFEDDEFRAMIDKLHIYKQNEPETRPAKRQRLGGAASTDRLNRYNYLHDKVVRLLGSSNQSSSRLEAASVPTFLGFEESVQLSLLGAVADMACAHKSPKSVDTARMKEESTPPCICCDRLRTNSVDEAIALTRHGNEVDELLDPCVMDFFEALVQRPEFHRMTKTRIYVLAAIRKHLFHEPFTGHLALGVSEIGQFCLKSLHSSSRELRLAAAFALPVFIWRGVVEQYRKSNRALVMDLLRQLSLKDDTAQLETTIVAWGQVAQACDEEELNLVILELVEFLGHKNSLICGVAFNELLTISDALECHPEDLLKPFSRSVSVSVVKDLLVRPQKIQQLADLLRTGVNQYILSTETETLPYLVLAKRKDVLEKLAAAHGPQTTVQDLCMQPRANLIAILSQLLLQPFADPEAAIMRCLCEIAPEFAEYDLSSLVKLDSILIMCEVLKAAGDAEDSTKPQIHRAIQYVAVLAETKPYKSLSKQTRTMLAFFEQHILGIMTHFTDVIENSRVVYPLPQKRRCFRAIEEVIKLSKGRIGIALPQLRACLQSALDLPLLRDLAFSAWATLVTTIGSDEILPLIENSFAIVAQNWSHFSEKSQQCAHETISSLIRNHEALIMDNVATIPLLGNIKVFSKIDSGLRRHRAHIDSHKQYRAFVSRCRDENSVIVYQAMLELEDFLEDNSQFVHDNACSENPHPVVAELIRAVLDACVAFKEDRKPIPEVGARCLGIIGCVDPNRIEYTKEKRDILILSNFQRVDEVIDFVALLFENVLVKAFRSASNARAQGFLAYAMQELLKFCGFHEGLTPKSRVSDDDPSAARWQQMPSSTRTTLTPFLSSRYLLTSNTPQSNGQSYPIFRKSISHSMWLRNFAFDLLRKGKGENAQTIFSTLSRVIHGHDLSIAAFLLPFAALHVVISGLDHEAEDIQRELVSVLGQRLDASTQREAETIKLCSESVFQILDYMSRWMQKKKKTLSDMQLNAQRLGTTPPEQEVLRDTAQISSVERVLQSVPFAVVAERAMDCQSYTRAVYHWDLHMREEKERCRQLNKEYKPGSHFERLQEMYAQIESPDAVEGLSAVLDFISPEQQLMEHVRSERWDAVQTWYEMKLELEPGNVEAQAQLARSLYESGQNNALLDLVNRLSHENNRYPSNLIRYAMEASWMTGRWHDLDNFLVSSTTTTGKSRRSDFEMKVAKIMQQLHKKDWGNAEQSIISTRKTIASSLSNSEAASFQACHDQLMDLHKLYELGIMSGLPTSPPNEKKSVLDVLDRRLLVLGSFMKDKQDMLRIRQTAMELSGLDFTALDLASNLTASARLARKTGKTTAANSAIIRAQNLMNNSALIEHARMLWKGGNHRNAIRMLEGAINEKAFQPYEIVDVEAATVTNEQQTQDNFLASRAGLLLAKWLDRSGQTHSENIIDMYQSAIREYPRWEKGHYHLGKHYNKLLEAERSLPSTKQSPAYLCGETAKLVIDNFLRAVAFGTRFSSQTLPRIITLWLEVGIDAQRLTRNADPIHYEARQDTLKKINGQIKKYSERLPAFVFYNSLPQLITRISHPQPEVWKLVRYIITKVISHHPQQALWSLMAVVRSSNGERSTRGHSILNELRSSKKGKKDGSDIDLKQLINHAQRLSDALLNACEVTVEQRATHVSLSRNLGFSLSMAPCQLVVPVEATLTPNLPAHVGREGMRNHKAFDREPITIAAFEDDVLVLSSLQRPRKLNVRGTDGKTYGLLCKPKDDLRKDQRLMEFNTMINRALKRDAEASKRRLYIKTYAVTPLNEECGAIEWVEGLKPIRDIIYHSYRNRGVKVDYNEIRQFLNTAISDGSDDTLHQYWNERLVKHFYPVLHEWFVESFPEPEAWFNARFRYTRSCAVMSFVGHVLGLGDRHGENILLQEGNGGVFHVDFNCLFDKGLTFEKPELVPFRLTHNMVDAMGQYGYEGPFRKSAELTMGILRAYEDTLMTILETFLYDPTQDFIGKKSRKASTPETPQEVLDNVRGKLRGLMKGESVPLSVEGYVEALIKDAVDARNLASMYIGWCAFW